MTQFSHTSGFTRGEVDPALFDRYDVDFYTAASEFIENWFPDVTGSIQRRPAITPYGDTTPFIIPKRPTGVSSDVECGDFFLRTFLFRGKVFILLFRRICTPGWQTITISCYRLDDNVPVMQFEDEYLVYYSEASTDLETLLTPDLPPDSFDGEVPVEFADGLAQNICLAQIGPAVFITSPLFPPYRVFVDPNFDADYQLVQFYEELLGTVEVSSGGTSWTGTDSLFQDQLSNGDKFYFQNTEYTVSTVTSQTALTATTSYSGVSVAGGRISIPTSVFEFDWPRLCTFHKGRLFLFSSRENPVSMWASKSNDAFTIIPGTVYDDAPIQAELLTEGAEGFKWVRAADQLFLGGEQAEYVISAPLDGPLTPSLYTFYRVSSTGGASLQPFNTDASTVYVNRGRSKIQAVTFDDTRNGFVNTDFSLLAPHLLTEGIRDLVYRSGTKNDRTPRIFVHTDEKNVRTCTLAEQQNVIAWSRITVADNYTIEAVGASPDTVFLIMQCPDEETYVLCRLDFESLDFYLLDMEWKYTAVAGVVSLENMHHDTTVAVLDGSRFVGFFDVTDTLDIDEADFDDELVVGIPYNSKITMLPVNVDTRDGGTLNRKHRLVRVLVSVDEAYELSINGQPVFGTLATNTTTGFAKREGTYEKRFFGWSERPETRIEASSIYRARIRSVTREVSF
jgi:hypothetical protein